MNALSKRRIDEIRKVHAQIAFSAKKTIELVIRLGAMLAEAKETLNHGEFVPWVEQNLPFSMMTAQRYMRMFHEYAKRYQAKYVTVTHLKNNTVLFLDEDDMNRSLPSPEEIPIGEEYIREVFGDEATLSDVYVQAGIKKILRPKNKEISSEELGPEERAITRTDIDKARVMLVEPAGDFPLKLHCIAVDDGRAVAARRDREGVWSLGLVTIPKQAGAEEAWEELMADLKLCFEKYYSRIEELERLGVIDPPADYSIGKRIRGKGGEK